MPPAGRGRGRPCIAPGQHRRTAGDPLEQLGGLSLPAGRCLLVASRAAASATSANTHAEPGATRCRHPAARQQNTASAISSSGLVDLIGSTRQSGKTRSRRDMRPPSPLRAEPPGSPNARYRQSPRPWRTAAGLHRYLGASTCPKPWPGPSSGRSAAAAVHG
eukprot:9500069-Pyramimonas_sp.AAC.1